MAIFLIDVNLPYYFHIWHNERFVHLKDINDEWTDEQIWNYAKDNNLTIVSKDSDFSNKVLYRNPPPKVIHIKIGNLKMNEFHELISQIWLDIEEMTKNYKLVNVYRDRIEGIN